MIISRSIKFTTYLVVGLLSLVSGGACQTLPVKGPGLGNLEYTDAELFRAVSIIRANTRSGLFTLDGTYIANGTVIERTDSRYAAVASLKEKPDSGIEDAPNGALKVVSGKHTIGFPAYRYGGSKLFGTNVGVMLNGYFLTSFAPDSGQSPGGFLLYDLEDPRNPKLVKTIYEPTGRTAEFREPHAYGVSIINGRTYVAIPSKFGVEFWDFTDINNIQQVKKLALPGVNGGDYEDVNWQMAWQAPYLYVASASRGLYIIEASDPKNAKIADRGPGFRNPLSIGRMGGFRIGPLFALGNQLVVSGMETSAGFSTMDISNPLHPVLVNTRTSLPFYYATCFNGKTIYSSGRNANGIMVGVDISNPRNYVVENSTTPMREGLYCATQDNFLISGNQADIVKLDVSNPAKYIEVGRSERVGSTLVPEPNNQHNMSPDLGQVAVFGNLVFVGSDHGVNTAFRPHQKAPDKTPPAIIAQSPANLAQNQASTTRIGIALSDSILPETVNAENFIVRRKGGAQVQGIYSSWLGMVNFSPATALERDSEYEVVLTANGLKDFARNGLAQEVKFTFKTAKQDIEPVPEFIYSQSYVYRWPLATSLQDVTGRADAVSDPAVKFIDGSLDTTQRTVGIELKNDNVANTLAESATVSFRIKTLQVGNDSMWKAPGILGRDHIGGSNDIFWGWIDASGNLNLQVGDDTARKVRSGKPINDNAWHQVIMSRSAETGELAMYVDGVKTSSVSGKGSVGLSNKIHMIGQIDKAPAFRGYLSDLRIYSRVLNDFEARAIFQPDANVLPQQQTGQVAILDPAKLGLIGVKFNWNFGDGNSLVTTASETPATHIYANPGNYTVTVTAVDANGIEKPYAFNQTVIHPLTPVAPVHTSNIVGNGKFVYSLDPDSGTIAQIDVQSHTKNWELRVGREPKTLALDSSGHVWVAVQGEDKLVKINPTTKDSTSFPQGYGSAPYGIVFTKDGYGLVTLSGKSALAIFNPFTGARSAKIDLPKGDLRGIAVTGDSATAYVTRFRSHMTQAEIYKVNLVARTASTIPLLVDTTTKQSEAAAPGVPNYVNQVVISPDGLRAILPSKKDNIVDGRFRTNTDIKPDTTVRSIISQVDLRTGSEVFAEQIDFNNRAPARAVVFSPAGNYVFVAQMESNSVEIVDTYRRVVVGVIKETGRTPHGLYLDATAKRLYINNFLDRTVTVHDISQVLSGVDFVTLPPVVIKTVATEPLEPNVLAGKKIFYNAADPRMSNESYISCASCHVDGDSDDMVWDFTQRGEGLRRTASLQGKRGMGQIDVKEITQPLDYDKTDLFSISSAVDELNSRIGVLKLNGLNTEAGTTILAELGRTASQLRANIRAISTLGTASELGLLASELDSLFNRVVSLLQESPPAKAESKLHWTGNFDELQDFEKDIRQEFGGSGFLSDADYQATLDTLGKPKVGLSSDLDNLAAYVSSLGSIQRSPYRQEDGCMTAEAQAGELIFQKAQCSTCHGSGIVQDGKRHDVGTIQASSGKGSGQTLSGIGFDTPNLYGVWQSSSFLHNGQAKTLEEVFLRSTGTSAANVSPEHGGAVSPTDVGKLVAYLKTLDGQPACPAGVR